MVASFASFLSRVPIRERGRSVFVRNDIHANHTPFLDASRSYYVHLCTMTDSYQSGKKTLEVVQMRIDNRVFLQIRLRIS